MSSTPTWHGRKFSGSPAKLQRKAKKKVKRRNSLRVDDPEQLESSILFGWYFSCNCGVSGSNIDDGKRSIMCDVCKVWMHCKCNGVPSNTEDLLFFFYKKLLWVCDDCKNGNFQYRSIHWKCDKKKKRKTRSVQFDESPKPRSRSRPVLDPTLVPSSPILKSKPKHFKDELQLPTPDSVNNDKPLAIYNAKSV